MATIKLTIFKAKALKDGRHKIRIALCHKQVTCYIITRFVIDSLSQFKDGMVVKRPDAAAINSKLRGMLNEYQERLDKINNPDLYSCTQLKDMIENAASFNEEATFQSVCRKYISELEEDGRKGYATLLERNNRYFTEFTKGDILLADITPVIIEGYSHYLKTKKR